MHAIEIEPKLKEKLLKLYRKDGVLHEREMRKAEDIAVEPHHYKDLGGPMKFLKRAHIGHFVLTFSIDEENKLIKLVDFDHHDNIYG